MKGLRRTLNSSSALEGHDYGHDGRVRDAAHAARGPHLGVHGGDEDLGGELADEGVGQRGRRDDGGVGALRVDVTPGGSQARSGEERQRRRALLLAGAPGEERGDKSARVGIY